MLPAGNLALTHLVQMGSDYVQKQSNILKFAEACSEGEIQLPRLRNKRLCKLNSKQQNQNNQNAKNGMFKNNKSYEGDSYVTIKILLDHSSVVIQVEETYGKKNLK